MTGWLCTLLVTVTVQYGQAGQPKAVRVDARGCPQVLVEYRVARQRASTIPLCLLRKVARQRPSGGQRRVAGSAAGHP